MSYVGDDAGELFTLGVAALSLLPRFRPAAAESVTHQD
jgi:hypothetical protein